MRGVNAEVRNKVLACPTLHLGGHQYKCADTVDPRMKAIFLIMRVFLGNL